MKRIEEEFNKIVMSKMVFSVVYALFGLLVFLKSEMTNKAVGVVIGTFFLIYGLISIFTSIDKNRIQMFRYNMFFGIISIILGIFIMFNPLSILNVLNISLGIWLVVEGINKFVYFIYLKKVGDISSQVLLVSSILLLFLGVIIILNPFRSIVITRTIGIFIMLYNILNLCDLVLLKRRAKEFLKLFK